MSDPLYPPSDFGEAFEAAAARLREAVADACARPAPWPGRVCAAIEAAVEFAAVDPAAARLLLVEPWAHGAAGAERRERLYDHFAALLAAGREELSGGERLPELAEQVLVAAVAAILGRRLAPGGEGEPPLRALAAELIEFVLLPYIGHTRARVWARLRRVDPGRPRLRAGEGAQIHPVEFTEVLARLQGMIGAEAQVVIDLPGCFFDCGFHARLERVETLSGDEGPVLLVFAGAQGIALAPGELKPFLATWAGSASTWIELHVEDRLRIVIERLGEPDRT